MKEWAGLLTPSQMRVKSVPLESLANSDISVRKSFSAACMFALARTD